MQCLHCSCTLSHWRRRLAGVMVAGQRAGCYTFQVSGLHPPEPAVAAALSQRILRCRERRATPPLSSSWLTPSPFNAGAPCYTTPELIVADPLFVQWAQDSMGAALQERRATPPPSPLWLTPSPLNAGVPCYTTSELIVADLERCAPLDGPLPDKDAWRESRRVGGCMGRVGQTRVSDV